MLFSERRVFDTDRAAAARSRERLFDRVAGDNILIAGMHLHFPSFGRLVRYSEGGYRFCPEAEIRDVHSGVKGGASLMT